MDSFELIIVQKIKELPVFFYIFAPIKLLKFLKLEVIKIQLFFQMSSRRKLKKNIFKSVILR